MPRVKYFARSVKLDHTMAVLRGAAKQSGVRWKDIAAQIGMNPTSLSLKLKAGSDNLTLGFLKQISPLVQCPAEELAKAIMEDLKL